MRAHESGNVVPRFCGTSPMSGFAGTLLYLVIWVVSGRITVQRVGVSTQDQAGQAGCITGSGLVHGLLAVDVYGFLADANISCDLFVGHSTRQQVAHMGLP